MLLDGSQLSGFIKERHRAQVRAMARAPKLAIVQAASDNATNAYIRAKRNYGEDIGASVDVYSSGGTLKELNEIVAKLNNDASVDGLIVQLPLPDATITDQVVNLVTPTKDIDGLAQNSLFTPPTPLAILWLLAGFNIDWKAKTVAIVGTGRLVGAPLAKLMTDSGASVITCNKDTADLQNETLKGEIVVTATGVAGLITANMIKPEAVLVDAGGSYETGRVAGEFAPALYADREIKITPNPGGVGPMTVSALFDNLIQAAGRGRE